MKHLKSGLLFLTLIGVAGPSLAAYIPNPPPPSIPPTASVPEPESIGLLLAGIIGVYAARRKNK
ncbi:MAG: hypothetical protein JWM78_3652 [Verrucomicrobiaceae bacterium]|nr:hypothetical protein [Verrucomicrobiaceae bacterium]